MHHKGVLYIEPSLSETTISISSGLQLELWLLKGNKVLLLTHNDPGVDMSFTS